VKYSEIQHLIVCPNHISSVLVEDIPGRLICPACVSLGAQESIRFLNKQPLKIDFLNGFTSELPSGKKKKEIRYWTKWRQANLQFLLSRKIAVNSLGVDIGAGNGTFHSHLSLVNVISVDFTNYEGINLVCDLNAKIPLAGGAFDYVLLTSVLEHLYDFDVVIEANRLLKKGGKLYITVPLLHEVHQEPYDFHRYTYIYLEQRLEEEGFEIEYLASFEDLATLEAQSWHYFKFYLSEGNLGIRILWKIQRVIFRFLRLSGRVSCRKSFTLGYMISAVKK
jgi:SAM-dependent methyltransferase